jgi:D-alanyl-lipoteichoic acid acyltransferase DltB (MBOAT superfamily)
MLFNSVDFAIFFPVVFFVYWLLSKNLKTQNLFLLAASYFFYGWWNWRYLSLVLLCTITNYVAGSLLKKTMDQKRRKTILILCCLVSLGVLGVFKYYDFFVNSFADAFSCAGIQLHIKNLNLLVPVGISFYTFHTLSYTIDVYRGKFEPTGDVVSFSLFVSIFPLAMAGPIERASNLLPQITKQRTYNHDVGVDGLRQILWGLFKKVVIADNCATYVNNVFDTYQSQSGSTLLLGAILFSFQIYGDFSGYSDMALGIGKLLGFRFLNNFSYPYFSRNIAEFWQRWHISLTSWLTDYVFMPLNIKWRDWGKWGIISAIMTNFLICGLWHGANWTFLLFGIYHGLLYIPLILSGAMFKKAKKIETNQFGLPKLKPFGQMLLTFLLVTIGMLIFRANSLEVAIHYIGGIFSRDLFSIPLLYNKMFVFLAIMLSVEWTQRGKPHGLVLDKIQSHAVKFAIYYVLLTLIFVYGTHAKTFIYFQF